MALDISHYMLTYSPVNPANCFKTEDWDSECNVLLKNYSKFITDINVNCFDKAIAIVKNEQVLENLKKCELFNEMNYMEIFVGSLKGKMRTDLARYIKNEKLDKLERSGL